jgi:hypothetical protein
MADLTVKGVIKLINPIKVISDKFQIREFVITTGDKFLQDIMFQTLNDRMDIIKPYGVGQEVEVSFNLRGRQVGDKFYNSLDAWRVQGEAKVQDAFTTLIEDDPF